MPPSAHTALVVSIVASAIGALAMCLMVARYGLRPISEREADRALLATRFGHALAGVCFAATGILAVVALSVPRESGSAATTIVKVEPDRAAESRFQELATEVKALAARLEQAEARLTVVDSAARRLGDEVGSIGSRAKELERTIAALPRRTVVAEPPRPAERPTPPPVTTDPPSAMPAPTPAPAPTRAAEPPVSARVAPSSGRAGIEAPARGAASAAATTKPDEAQLTGKIRDDWKTIRGGFETAGDDFKAAVRDLGRKLWR